MDVPNDAAIPPTVVKVDPAIEALARFRRRGRLFFTFLAFWAGILGSVVIVFGATDHPFRSIIVAIIAVAIGIAVDVALVFGLAERRPWADRSTIVVCGIFLVAGVLRSLIKLSSGTVEIPLDSIGAALVLAVRPTTLAPALPGDRRRIGLVAAAALLSAVSPLIGDEAASGRILGASADQVRVAVTVDCDAMAADPAAPVVVRASWHWTGGEILARGTDGFVVSWLAATDADADGEGALEMYEAGPVEVAPMGAVWSGSGSPASALTDPIEAQGNAHSFGIDVGRFGLVDGQVVIPLRPVPADAGHGSVQVSAQYAHLDRWITDPGLVGCVW